MKVVYAVGPDKVVCGAAGTFRRNEPREVSKDLAERLLAKTSIKFTVAEPAKTKEV